MLNKADSIITIYDIPKDVLAKWTSIDPLTSKYPSNSPYAFVSNNPIILYDPDGRDEVYFNTHGEEVYREKSNNVFKTYIMANMKAGKPQISKLNWKEVPMPKIIQERTQSSETTTSPQYQAYDYLIAARTGYFNQGKNNGQLTLYTEGGNQIPADVIKNIPDLDPTLVKAMAIQESHCGTTGISDIMQSNVSGDWNGGGMKSKYGLEQDVTPSESNSLYAGIRILATKGFKDGITYNPKDGTSTYTFQGWDNAVGAYNSSSGTTGYQTFITDMVKNAQNPVPSNYSNNAPSTLNNNTPSSTSPTYIGNGKYIDPN